MKGKGDCMRWPGVQQHFFEVAGQGVSLIRGKSQL